MEDAALQYTDAVATLLVQIRHYAYMQGSKNIESLPKLE
jgi:hypothetical protein